MLNSAAWLITQRSQVQILPPLPGSAGQRPDRQDGVRHSGCLSAVRPWDLALGRGMLRGGSAEIGIAGWLSVPIFF